MMKNIVRISLLLILAFGLLTGCEYEYNKPGLYVEYQFKVSVENDVEFLLSTVDEYGYEFLGQDVACFFIDDNGNVKDYKESLWADDIFALKKEYSGFQIEQICYGQPKIPGSHKSKVCTIIYKPVDMEKYKLYGEAQKPCPGIITFRTDDIERIEYNPEIDRVYTIQAEMDVDPKYVTDYGYVFAEASRFYQFYDSELKLQETQQLRTGDLTSTTYPYTGGYCVYYGLSGRYKIEICKVFYKTQPTESLISTSSKFEIERVEYNPEIDRVYTIQAEMDVDPKYVTDYGYVFAEASRFYQFYDSELKLQETQQLRTGDLTSTTYPYTGGYCVYYGLSERYKIEICKVFYKPQPTESLILTSSKFEIERVEYNPDAKRLTEFYITMPTDVSYVEDRGYELAAAERYYQFYDEAGNLKETKKRPDGENIVTTEYPFAGGYIDYYGYKGNYQKVKVCTAYFKRESSEFLKENSSKTTPYVLSLEKVEYYDN